MVKVQDINSSISHENITFRYCTEAMLVREQAHSTLQDVLRNKLASYGDSLVVAGSHKKLRLHIHTDTPAKIFSLLEPYGLITFQKVDDMVMQKELVNNRQQSIGLLTDSICDIPKEIQDKYQIQSVPVKIQFGEQYFL
ncbi:MAG: fatty acid-binding protein DegV, partial [Bacteroidetes bacterium 4572_77]